MSSRQLEGEGPPPEVDPWLGGRLQPVRVCLPMDNWRVLQPDPQPCRALREWRGEGWVGGLLGTWANESAWLPVGLCVLGACW